MARGPQGQYRPNDPVASAMAVVRIATGEATEGEEIAKAVARHRKPATYAKARSLEDKG